MVGFSVGGTLLLVIIKLHNRQNSFLNQFKYYFLDCNEFIIYIYKYNSSIISDFKTF